MLRVRIKELKPNLTSDKLINRLQSQPYPFFLESSMRNKHFGRYSFFGAAPFLVIQSKGSEVTTIKHNSIITKKSNPFKELKNILQKYLKKR